MIKLAFAFNSDSDNFSVNAKICPRSSSKTGSFFSSVSVQEILSGAFPRWYAPGIMTFASPDSLIPDPAGKGPMRSSRCSPPSRREHPRYTAGPAVSEHRFTGRRVLEAQSFYNRLRLEENRDKCFFIPDRKD